MKIVALLLLLLLLCVAGLVAARDTRTARIAVYGESALQPPAILSVPLMSCFH
jgi:hypothetical protein